MTTVTRETAVPVAKPKPRREPPEVTILKEARKLIERGWVQGVTVALREDGVGYRYCARGALIANRDTAKNFFASYTRAGALLDAEAPPLGPHNVRCIVWFNDDPATTKQDILDAYDRAIQKALKGAS